MLKEDFLWHRKSVVLVLAVNRYCMVDGYIKTCFYTRLMSLLHRVRSIYSITFFFFYSLNDIRLKPPLASCKLNEVLLEGFCCALAAALGDVPPGPPLLPP